MADDQYEDDDPFDDEELYDDEEDLLDEDEDLEESFLGFLGAAVAEALETEDSAAFLDWMREEAPEWAPELFDELPNEQARRSLAWELGRSLWNVIPLPGNGFRPRPLPRPERNDPCPCGSGRKYKRCCGELAGAVPAFEPEVVWMLVVEALSQEETAALGQSGRIPRGLAGELATKLLDDGEATRALGLVQPLFERPERLDERDAAALNALLEAYDELELVAEKQEAVDRLARQLEPGLRAVLWENLVRSHALEGEFEQAWAALEKAQKDDPGSVALGPLEVSLLLAERRTQEAGERARFHRQRLPRDPEAISEEGREFLDKVSQDPEDVQLEFTLGRETATELRLLQDRLAEAEPPSAVYEIEPVEGDPGAGRLVTPDSLLAAERVFAEVFDPVFLAVPGFEDEMEDGEDLDPWDELQAGRWLHCLRSTPGALENLAVLADAADAVNDLVAEQFAFLDQPLLRPLLDRGLAILDRSLAVHPEITRLPQSEEANLPALGVIMLAASQANRLDEGERALELLRRMRSLNPAVSEE